MCEIHEICRFASLFPRCRRGTRREGTAGRVESDKGILNRVSRIDGDEVWWWWCTKNNAMSRHYRHRISPPLFFFFFLATCVAFVAFAIDRSNAIRVPDFTTGIKSKFSVMNESVKMMNPKNRRAKELEEREALMKDAYGDDKIVGWDAVNNKPIYDENWSSNKALLEKYNPGSTAREDLPKYKHLADREEEQNWLYRNRYVDNCLSCT